MRKFNTIKKSRKKSKDIDEKIEYLNKECQKTGLNEITMSTSGIYRGTTQVPNQDYNDFSGLSQGGYGFGLSADDGNSIGGASVGINPSTNQPNVALSPPHPVTGVIRVASTITSGTGSNRALRPGIGTRHYSGRTIKDGSALWFFDSNYSLGGIQGRWRNLEWFDGNLGFWDTNFLGFFFHNTNLDQLQLSGVNIGTQIKNKIADINFGPNGAVGEPKTIVLTQNDLGDPSHIPINIGEMSPQAYDTILDKANRDKVDRIARTGRYPNASDQKFLQDYLNSISDPARQQSERMRIFKLNGVWFPLASAGSAEPVSDTNIPGPLAGAQDGDQIAMFGGKPTPPTKKSDFKGIKRNAATTAATMSVNGMGMSPAAFEKKYGISPQDFLNLPENKTSDKKYLEEGVKLGHFEPEVLNVDINDIRKGIMPEFPKDPPPEMIGGYSAKSRLVRKDPKLPPFIKVTRKDLAKNHLLTDKEITKFMNDIKLINEYIKKNPAELIYAMTRYPKDDPRLAQLNFKMDQMKAASDEYVETHFPENERLFNKLQAKIKNNIELTDPKNFAGHAEAPKFTDVIDVSEQKKKIMIKHLKNL